MPQYNYKQPRYIHSYPGTGTWNKDLENSTAAVSLITHLNANTNFSKPTPILQRRGGNDILLNQTIFAGYSNINA